MNELQKKNYASTPKSRYSECDCQATFVHYIK